MENIPVPPRMQKKSRIARKKRSEAPEFPGTINPQSVAVYDGITRKTDRFRRAMHAITRTNDGSGAHGRYRAAHFDGMGPEYGRALAGKRLRSGTRGPILHERGRTGTDQWLPR